MTRCPECDAEIDLDEDEVEEGEILSCHECDAELEVTQTHPVHLIAISDDEDEEEDDEEESAEEAVVEEEEEERRGSRMTVLRALCYALLFRSTARMDGISMICSSAAGSSRSSFIRCSRVFRWRRKYCSYGPDPMKTCNSLRSALLILVVLLAALPSARTDQRRKKSRGSAPHRPRACRR